MTRSQTIRRAYRTARLIAILQAIQIARVVLVLKAIPAQTARRILNPTRIPQVRLIQDLLQIRKVAQARDP